MLYGKRGFHGLQVFHAVEPSDSLNDRGGEAPMDEPHSTGERAGKVWEPVSGG